MLVVPMVELMVVLSVVSKADLMVVPMVDLMVVLSVVSKAD